MPLTRTASVAWGSGPDHRTSADGAGETRVVGSEQGLELRPSLGL